MYKLYDSVDVVIKTGDKEIEIPYLKSDTIYYSHNTRDYVEGKLIIEGETDNGVKVSMNDIDCKLYKDGTLKGEKYGFTIEGRVKEG
jgi:hypothetical protein